MKLSGASLSAFWNITHCRHLLKLLVNRTTIWCNGCAHRIRTDSAARNKISDGVPPPSQTPVWWYNARRPLWSWRIQKRKVKIEIYLMAILLGYIASVATCEYALASYTQYLSQVENLYLQIAPLISHGGSNRGVEVTQVPRYHLNPHRAVWHDVTYSRFGNSCPTCVKVCEKYWKFEKIK